MQSEDNCKGKGHGSGLQKGLLRQHGVCPELPLPGVEPVLCARALKGKGGEILVTSPRTAWRILGWSHQGCKGHYLSAMSAPAWRSFQPPSYLADPGMGRPTKSWPSAAKTRYVSILRYLPNMWKQSLTLLNWRRAMVMGQRECVFFSDFKPMKWHWLERTATTSIQRCVKLRFVTGTRSGTSRTSCTSSTETCVPTACPCCA